MGDRVTPQQVYRDLADNGRLDARYTAADLKQALDVPLAGRGELPPLRIAIQAAPRQSETATPRTATPEFWIALLLLAMLAWWCVDRLVITAKRKR